MYLTIYEVNLLISTEKNNKIFVKTLGFPWKNKYRRKIIEYTIIHKNIMFTNG